MICLENEINPEQASLEQKRKTSHIPRNMALGLALIELLYWFASAVNSYTTVFLQKNGFTPKEVGTINAIINAVVIVATPIWGVIADKIGSLRKAFIIAMCTASVLYALLPGVASAGVMLGAVPMLLVLLPLAAFFRRPCAHLMDGFVVQTAANTGVAYGNIRIWGSISYAVMNFILAAILPKVGVSFTFYLVGIMFIPLFVLLIHYRGLDELNRERKDLKDSAPKKERKSLKELQLGRVFKNYYFITFLVFAVVFHMPTNTSYTFLPYLVELVGGDSAKLGLVSGYKALLEVPMLLLIKPMRKKFPLPYTMLLAMVFYICESLLYSVAQSLTAIILIQTLHGFAGGLVIGTATNYVHAMAPEGLEGTAQSINGMANSLAAILGNAMGGYLIEILSIRVYYRVCCLMIAAAAIYFGVTLFIGQKVLKKPLPPAALPSFFKQKEEQKA